MLLNKLLYSSLLALSKITSGNWSSKKEHEIPKIMHKILLWTWPSNSVMFWSLTTKGQKVFIDKGCRFTNCYLTWDTQLDYTEFDVILFEPKTMSHVKELPRRRKLRQKYVFASIDSPAYYPITSAWNGFFNWTWTYHLDSDARWGFIVVRDINGRVVGPSKEMHWIKWEDMAPVSNSFKKSLLTKTKAAAWFASNCRALNKIEDYVLELKAELKYNYELRLDIFGGCSDNCGKRFKWGCPIEIIKKGYFFYIAFENSNCDDLVTEKILHGLNLNAIPIVYGTANYTRFMPDGSYLNAGQMKVTELAAKMNELIHDKAKYAEYFKWKNHYSYDDSTEDNPCNLCELLNNEKKVKQTTVYHNIAHWWNSQKNQSARQYRKFYGVTYLRSQSGLTKSSLSAPPAPVKSKRTL